MGDSAVYLLECMRTGRTYIGQTNCFTRRLRQHRGELSGGARATRGMKVRPVVLVRGDLTLRERLQLEKKWKRVRVGAGCPAARRVRGLKRVLELNRWFKSQAVGDVARVRKKVSVQWVHVPEECKTEVKEAEWTVHTVRENNGVVK